jgi:hypothetical protein
MNFEENLNAGNELYQTKYLHDLNDFYHNSDTWLLCHKQN